MSYNPKADLARDQFLNEKAEQLWNRESYGVASSLISRIIELEPDLIDDIPFPHGPHEISAPDADGATECELCGDQFDADETQERADDPDAASLEHCPDNGREVYEWWFVSSWFAEKLEDRGECVWECYGRWVWGRTCTGQSVMLDGTIHGVAADLWRDELAELVAS